MLAIVSAAFAGNAEAAAGRTEFVIGGVTVARGSVERPLTRGAELDTGDTVRTNNGRAQIRFTDGAYVSLQPNTEYSIRDYRYDKSGEERGFFGLLRGAMRTVTGAIGRLNRTAYRITTPTATVGIRGTGGVIQVQDDGSTLVIGTSGIWSLTNPAGSVDVPAGTSALAPTDPNQPPQETTQQPTSGPAPVPEEEPVFVAGNEVDDQGLPVIPSPSVTPLVTGSGYTAALASSFFTGQGVFDATIDGGGFNTNFRVSDAVFDGQGRLTSITDSSRGTTATLTTGQHGAESATDGILAWGRWTNGQVDLNGVPETYTPNQGLHYVVGMPTASMPTSGTATYSLAGATSPTYADGRSPPGTFTGSLDVTFGASALIGGSFAVAMPDGKNWQWSTATSASGAFFSMQADNAGSSFVLTGTGGACGSVSSCRADVTGFFAGASAERAGIGYLIHDTSSATIDVVGTAAFKKN